MIPKGILLRGELVNNVVAGSDDWAKVGKGKHLEPGLVRYEAVLNEDGTVKTPEITYLLTREAIAKMRPTAEGKPIVGSAGGFDHMKVNAQAAAKGQYDGEAIRSYDGGDGWEWIDFIVRDPDTKDKCRGGYQFSCAYVPTQADETPGKWHNIPYDAVIIDGVYTHFAVVPVPRYDGAAIELKNSLKDKGGIVNKALTALIRASMSTKQVRELANSMEREEKAKDMKDKAKSEYENALRNAADDAAKEKAKAEFEKKNAEADAFLKEGDAERAAAEKEAAARKEKIGNLRNAADALDKVEAGKGKDLRDEADKLEKMHLGGGDVPRDPGVIPTPPVKTNDLSTDAAPGRQVSEPVAPTPVKEPAAGGQTDAQKREAEEAERVNSAAAFLIFQPEMLDEAVSAKVLTELGRAKPLADQPEEVRNAWNGVYAAAGGKTVDEKKSSLLAKATKVVELRNATRARIEEETRRTERFNALRKAAEDRGASTGGIPTLGSDSTEDKAALGEQLYG